MTVIVTGSAGLVGNAVTDLFIANGHNVVGIDNDSRGEFFGPDGSTITRRHWGPGYTHEDCDIRDENSIRRIFGYRRHDIRAVIHCAAQPSHDWAIKYPMTDFGVNATGTLNLLEAARKYCPEAPFVFMSTNKVYGDQTNEWVTEQATRYDLEPGNDGYNGVTEEMSIDKGTRSLYGAGKLAADILVQEYGRYFGLPTVCFRAGCLTGPNQAGVQQHGFLNYIMRCAVKKKPYAVIGYGGKQVRDNLHAEDVASAILAFVQAPSGKGVVYNLGGGRVLSVSILEALDLAYDLTGLYIKRSLVEKPRRADHIWWITDTSKFQRDYPQWRPTYNMHGLMMDLRDGVMREAA